MKKLELPEKNVVTDALANLIIDATQYMLRFEQWKVSSPKRKIDDDLIWSMVELVKDDQIRSGSFRKNRPNLSDLREIRSTFKVIYFCNSEIRVRGEIQRMRKEYLDPYLSLLAELQRKNIEEIRKISPNFPLEEQKKLKNGVKAPTIRAVSKIYRMTPGAVRDKVAPVAGRISQLDKAEMERNGETLGEFFQSTEAFLEVLRSKIYQKTGGPLLKRLDTLKKQNVENTK